MAYFKLKRKNMIHKPFVSVYRYLKASKTLLFNFVLGLAGALEAYSGFLRNMFESDQAFGMFMVSVATIGAVLRFVTTQSVAANLEKGDV